MKGLNEMGTPTVSMQIFNEQNRRAAVSERQRKAAKKAWRTRRRKAMPTNVQYGVLKALSRDGVQLKLRFCDWGQSAGFRESMSVLAPRLKVAMATARVLRERGWIECVEKQEIRDSAIHRPDGIEWHWSRYTYWQLSNKGEKSIATFESRIASV